MEVCPGGRWRRRLDRNFADGEVVSSKRYKEIYGFAADELEIHTEVGCARSSR